MYNGLTSVCTGIVLVPLEVNPVMPVDVEAVHENVVPVTFDVRVTSIVLAPEQIVCVSGELVTAGFGFTTTGTLTGVPGQPFAVGVMVYVIVASVTPVFVNTWDMLPCLLYTSDAADE